MAAEREGHEIWVFMTLVVGFSLSFLVAIVPHYNGSYRLEALALGAWLVPYAILAVIIWFLRGPVRLRVLLSVALIQVLTDWVQRAFLGDPGGALSQIVALVTAVGLLLLIPQLQGRIDEGPLGPLARRLLRRG
jgi:hypothetical protein